MSRQLFVLLFSTMANISQIDPRFGVMTALFAAGAGFLEMLPHFKTLHQNRARYQRLAQALETETTRLLTNSNDTEQEALIKRCCELFTLQQYSLSKQEMREIQDADEASNIILTRAKPYLDTLAPDEADVLQHLIRVCYAVVFPEKEHILELIDGDDINFVEVKEALEHIQQNLTDLPIAIQEEHFEAVHDAKQFSAMLLLDIPQKQYREGFTSPTMLLRADLRRPVPFHFREGTVADIRAWCDDDAPLKLQVYEGQGGTGKTRLFLEVCRMYRAQGWEAGFLQLNPGNSNTEELWPYLFQGQTPMLVVLDYAERQATEEFQRLLVAMYEATMGQHLAKLRIVLLTRTTGDWWEQLQEDSALSNYLSSETVEPPKVLPSLTSVESDDLETQQQRRNESLMRAASHFAELRDKDVPTAPDDLSATYFERALYLHLQALASVEGEGVLSEARLLDFILNREKQFLREQLRARDLRESLLDSDALLQAVVVFTAMQGLHTREEALSVLEQLSLLQGLAPDELAAVADLLHETYAGVQWIEPIMPDILIEELYSRHATDEVLAIMLDHENADVLRVLNHINALAQRRSEQCALLKFAFQGRMDKLWQAGIEVTLSTGDPIGQVMADVLTDNPDATLAKTIYAAIPRYTVVLRELSAAAAQQVYDTVATGDLEQKATWAHNLAVHLGEVGKKKDALATAQEATRTYRRLVTTHSKEFLPYLATSLNNLGTRFNALNRHKEALAALEEAVSIRRKLDSDHPYDFLPDLAVSLNNLGNLLTGSNRNKEGLAALKEAVSIYEKLDENNRLGASLPQFAGTLSNLGMKLEALGQREKALPILEKSVSIYRELNTAYPDAFLPYLATSLNNLGSMFDSPGYYTKGLAFLEESVNIRRELAAARPNAFLYSLATSLDNLVIVLETAGELKKALVYAEESVDSYRKLNYNHPDEFLGHLAGSLNRLSHLLVLSNKNKNALLKITEAVTIIGPLYQKSPKVFAAISRNICHRYKECCKSLGEIPDTALLDFFQNLNI